MPRKSVIVSVDLPLESGHIQALLSSVPESEGTQSQKISNIALGALESLAEGGLMLRAPLVQRMSEALGRDVQDSDVVEKFEAGCGREGGRLLVQIPIDPANEGILKQVAEANGIESIAELVRRDMEVLWDNGYFYNAVPSPRRVIMSESDYDALKEALGKEFDNGTELAALVKERLAEKQEAWA